MKFVIPIVFFLFFAAPAAMAQTATEKTSSGDLKITPIQHGTLMLEFAGKVIHVDPWSRADLSKYPKADWIFITDIHQDHYDPKGIEAVKKAGTKVVAPAVVAEKFPEAIVLKNGESQTFDGIRVEALPMYNLEVDSERGVRLHEKGRGNGYVFNFGDKRLFVSGDTDCIPEILQLKNIAIAFLAMYARPTMSPQEAAQCAMQFKPKIVYAYHYGSDDPTIAQRMLAGTGIEMRIGPPSGL